MPDNSRAGSQQALLGDKDSAPRPEIGDETEGLTNMYSATGAGRIADLIALTIDGSGTQRTYLVECKDVNEQAINLLQQWINEYGNDRAPDLDQQIEELKTNRLHLHQGC